MYSPPDSELMGEPLYSREIFTSIEAELANDGYLFELQNTSGDTAKSKNANKGAGVGAQGLPPGARKTGNMVSFQNERNLHGLQDRRRPELFFPAYNSSTIFEGPNRTEQETRETFARILKEFEASEEGVAIASLIQAHLKGFVVDKIIAFGLGRIGFQRPGPLQSFYEHAAAKVVAKAVADMSSSQTVSLIVQDILYTDVCKKVLEDFGFDVIEGFGAKGFAIMDDKTVVLAHHPSCPFRSIIADIARPALICMREESAAAAHDQSLLLADADSTNSREMLKEYSSVSLQVSARQKAFWDNVWYVRTWML
ncbi:hypothetical protein F5Y03DRAFT_342062 [Xylaria venustula]|nr:hypothetical protein F5Y03DRAFT_342062 [Xylaria venustula]